LAGIPRLIIFRQREWRRQALVRIGISGWRYKGWRGVFYPEKLAQRRELEFASRQFGTIEMNGTFYSLQRPAYFAQWAEETPAEFVFSVKGSRYITHMLKLGGVERALARFLAQGVLRLGAKLGPILWQFPPNMHYQRERFEEFFELLPRSTRAAARFALIHGDLVGDRSWTEVTEDRPLRHCVEIRHESFAVPEFIDLLREQDVGQVVADTVEWPLLMDVTSDFVYCRLHGSEQLYASGYGDESLETWADRVAAWAGGGDCTTGRFVGLRAGRVPERDVFVYFDNDAKVRAPFDALGLRRRVEERMGGALVR
jgi:uncharacterized protein YecE (DUF72 family)